MQKHIVITHPEDGIYLGNFIGLGFWSQLDSAGQEHACVFYSKEDAALHIESWDGDRSPEHYGFAEVLIPEGESHASIEDLKAAGLGHLLGDMEDNRRKNLADIARNISQLEMRSNDGPSP